MAIQALRIQVTWLRYHVLLVNMVMSRNVYPVELELTAAPPPLFVKTAHQALVKPSLVRHHVCHVFLESIKIRLNLSHAKSARWDTTRVLKVDLPVMHVLVDMETRNRDQQLALPHHLDLT